jgi:hypothetical protein
MTYLFIYSFFLSRCYCHVRPSLLPPSGHRSCHGQECRSHNNHVGADTSSRQSCHLQNVSLATSETSLLPPVGHRSCHVRPSLLPPTGRRSCHGQECRSHSNHVGADTLSRRSCHLHNVSLSTSETSLLPPLKRLSCHLKNVSFSTSGTSLLPPSECLSCHL